MRILQQISILPLYFRYPLLKVDLLYLLQYWNKNPYRICKKYFQKNEAKEVLYGDTWPLSAYQFTQALQMNPNDVVYDVGCGIGRVCFWFQKISGCKVIGIEKVSFFVERAQKIQACLKAKRVEFLQKDLLDIDYQNATIIYFYSSSFSDDVIMKLIEKWKVLKKGARVLTTSFSLLDYNAIDYKVINSYKVSFPWGVCEVYLQERI